MSIEPQLCYNEELEPLEKLLAGIKRPGEFFVSGAMEIPLPKVDVEGAGVLSFPVPPAQIAALIQQATRAPYGRGEETIFDESVRKVWQLPPEKMRIGGKSWTATFDRILRQVSAGLGCAEMTVSAELYKLLIYDPGGFFLAHRDTEKAKRMFGTLTVVLPSAHRGGELVIRHSGREVTLDLAGAEVSEIRFAAFYADCEHEVRAITEGHRVALVYNLIQPGAARRKGQSLQAPDYEAQITAAAALLEKSLSVPGAPVKIAWLLEHQYSPDGLSFSGLKSADAARVQVLSQAAERADCAAHLGIVHIEESGAAEPTYHEYSPRHRRRFYGDDEDDDEDEEDFEVVEVCDWRHYVSQWRGGDDQPLSLGEIPLEEGELLPAGALDAEKPDEQRLLEASGNEGASFERSYHRAALVLWRRERYADVLLQAGVEAVLPLLRERIAACAGKNAPLPRARAVALARRLVEAWKGAPDTSYLWEPVRPKQRDVMLQLVIKLGHARLLEDFIAEVVARDYDGSENTALVAGAPLLGAAKTGTILTELVRQNMARLPGFCVDLLRALLVNGEALKSDWRDAFRLIAEAVVSQLDEIGKRPDDHTWLDRCAPAQGPALDAALVANLLDALGDLHAVPLRSAAVKKISARPEAFDPVTIVVPALKNIQRWDAASARLWEHSAEFLLDRSGHPPAAPQDWRQDAAISCGCADCNELQAFARDPVARTHRFRVRKDRRQHLHRQIESHGLDMTHATERIGSPQTLVCCKDRRTYERGCQQYRGDIAALRSLEEQAVKATSTRPELRKRIAAARARAQKWQPNLTVPRRNRTSEIKESDASAPAP